MKDALHVATEYAILLANALGLIVIVVGTLEACLGTVRLTWAPPGKVAQREVWMRYARWLVAGLTFQLAADILETSVAETWDAVARLGVIAVIRPFLNYFHEHDIEELRARTESGSGRTP